MKRRALIIGSSPSSDYLPGVKKDVESWERFLLSPAGGAWSASELDIVREPSREEAVERANGMADADYAELIFIGHGFIEDDDWGIPETFLCLNDDDAVSERELNPRSPWYLQIMDCCRAYEEVEESINLSKAASFLDPDHARSMFDNAILQSEKGWVKMYASDIGQGASDQNSFSNKLIAEAMAWSEKHAGILDTKSAYDLVMKRFERDNPQQTPVHNAGRRRRFFPIAVGQRS